MSNISGPKPERVTAYWQWRHGRLVRVGDYSRAPNRPCGSRRDHPAQLCFDF